MEMLSAIGKAFLVLLAVASVALPLVVERRNYEFVWQVWKRFRVRMFFEVVGVVLLTMVTVLALWGIPGLEYGWTSLFFDGSGGNVVIRPIMEGTESTSISVRLMVPAYFIAFAFVLPFLARSEERIFRKGYVTWGPILKQSVKFGLLHCLVGVPLAAGIALIIPGFFYGYKYKRAFDRNTAIGDREAEEEAVMVSTTYHTMYNMVVVVILLVIAFAAV